MQYPKISKARAVDAHTLIIEFSNAEIKEYTIHYLLENPIFFPLKQPAFFRNFKIEPGGHAIVWNESIDISEYELWKNGTSLERSRADKLFQALDN